MRDYTLDELSRAETYAADPQLATLARKTACATFKDGTCSIGDWKRAFLAGSHASAVAGALAAAIAELAAKRAAAESGRRALESLVLPTGWTHAINGDYVTLTGPYIDTLPARLRRIGGIWDDSARAWHLPLPKCTSLTRVFANAAQRDTETRSAKKVAKEHAELIRWLGYVESKVPDGYVYERGVTECRALGISTHPELATRLDVAIESARRIGREKAEQTRREAVERLQAQPQGPTQLRALVLAARPPAIGEPMRWRGRAIVVTELGKSFRIDEDAPSIHGSHLLGHEGALGRYAYYRDATDAEIAALESDEQAQREAHERQAALMSEKRALIAHIHARGECPRGAQTRLPNATSVTSLPIKPNGDTLLDTRTIHGGGDWFVVGPDLIWHVTNNGADGDDWANANIATGGAGAIGWCIPHDAQIDARLRALALAWRTHE